MFFIIYRSIPATSHHHLEKEKGRERKGKERKETSTKLVIAYYSTDDDDVEKLV